jgi:hypothetical protein
MQPEGLPNADCWKYKEVDVANTIPMRSFMSLFESGSACHNPTLQPKFATP